MGKREVDAMVMRRRSRGEKRGEVIGKERKND